MSDLIEEYSLGYKVYGVEQYGYTVGGVAERAFGEAMTTSAVRRALALEDVLEAYTCAVKKRQQKLDELASALATFSGVSASFNTDDKTDATRTSNEIAAANAICQKYGLSCNAYSFTGNSIQKGQISQVCTCIRYEIDKENTEMQQDMVQLQSYVSKRDSAFSLASKIQQVANSTISMGIKNIH